MEPTRFRGHPEAFARGAFDAQDPSPLCSNGGGLPLSRGGARRLEPQGRGVGGAAQASDASASLERRRRGWQTICAPSWCSTRWKWRLVSDGRAMSSTIATRAANTSLAFGKRCREAGVRPFMGSVGDAYDNAMAESFFLHARGRTAQPPSLRLPGRSEDGVLQLYRRLVRSRPPALGAGISIANDLRNRRKARPDRRIIPSPPTVHESGSIPVYRSRCLEL